MSNLNSNVLNNISSGNNKVSSATAKFFKVKFNKDLMIVLTLFLIFILIVFSIIVIIIGTNNNSSDVKSYNQEILLKYIHDAKNNPLAISGKNIPASTLGNEYSLSFWIYINSLSDYRADKKRDIITKGKVESSGIINTNNVPLDIHIEPNSTALKIKFKLASGTEIQDHLGCYNFNNNNESSPSPSPDPTYIPNENVGSLSIEDCRKLSNAENHSYFGMTNPTSADKADCYLFDEVETYKYFNKPVDNTLCQHNNNSPNNLGSQDYIFLNSTSKDENYTNSCTLDLIPVQRWCSVTINVHNNVCELFYDGKLYKTCLLSGSPVLNEDPVIIGNNGGFDGYISNVVWSTKDLHPSDIYNYYSKGPRMRLTSLERIKYIFSKKPKELEDYEADQKENEESGGRV